MAACGARAAGRADATRRRAHERERRQSGCARPDFRVREGLQERGWTIGGNVRVEYRWGAGDLDRFRKYAAELVALAPDVIVATAGSIVGDLQQASRTIPIVFVTTIDPVG